MKLLYEKEMPLLNRKRVAFLIEHSKAQTPSRESIIKKIAEDLKVKEELVAVRHIYTKFGETNSKVIANVYQDEKDVNFLEDIPRSLNKKKEKKEGSK